MKIHKSDKISRRDFIKTSAAASLAAVSGGFNKAFAAGSDKIRIAIIGCGGQGTSDMARCLRSAPNLALVAAADLFDERVQKCINSLKTPDPKQTRQEDISEKIKVEPEKCFLGFDAYKKIMALDDVDLVFLTTPPHFRPVHLRAAIEAGKHVFAEKPVAIDPTGIRSVIETAQLADEKNLTILAGTQMRRMPHLVEGIKRIHNGDIGTILAGQCLRLGSAMTNWGPQKCEPEWSDMEWQIRRWLFIDWLSGDFIVEQHVHNLDITNWALDAIPVKCIATGGRQARFKPEGGNNIYDHMAVEYEYPNEVRIAYMGAQQDGITYRMDNKIIGTKGSAYLDFANAVIEGQNPFKYDGESYNPSVRQHTDQINAIRNGQHLNEGKRIAESSLTAIMGRMSAYTGRALKLDWVFKASKLDYSLEKYEFRPKPLNPVAIPGQTELI
jgi:predicted dehydrogenase